MRKMTETKFEVTFWQDDHTREQYRIDRDPVTGRYDAWHFETPHHLLYLGSTDLGEKARGMCEAHAERVDRERWEEPAS